MHVYLLIFNVFMFVFGTGSLKDFKGVWLHGLRLLIKKSNTRKYINKGEIFSRAWDKEKI